MRLVIEGAISKIVTGYFIGQPDRPIYYQILGINGNPNYQELIHFGPRVIDHGDHVHAYTLGEALGYRRAIFVRRINNSN
ncbi:MAG: hypothetical protein COY38_01270 [Candidatus Aenigmarchaeota archaeon CG_4_10_14_0_8_um_filter_37_24]|nr:hypothetical protein [Candidatus Aenigmarchaeota archaeon]OIN88359.1 MAG: hypothetical protein AUJ50_01140 [Candidatus Aenigmarchaeota archaeon CG1_02_38_14]PIV68542.1 MAG: hypothetical protein COS07_03735 [Candidatus Aenigmarchaeota archaeon CG01_land_8_20_14_3_00_37_9]PIW40832.1 MAG: hypothetical protein COW21_05145 [Candidatus Aenigmarchaeota archaeon CG15_BIG_FIL_POST_REV_8_21_14_020_37_27]PIX50657.1 MAG: hypothetical protein COZ52_02950 [Candidatus Aenigmarchaeota archaeon CG_4_8_14_3_u